MSLAAVADDEREGVVDAELAQAVGQPRPVAVGTRPVRTSVPVTTMPARRAHAGAARPAGGRQRRTAGGVIS
jgi:hypothetical protein